MRQNHSVFEGPNRLNKIVEEALRFYARHEYLHDDQRVLVLEIADYVKELPDDRS